MEHYSDVARVDVDSPEDELVQCDLPEHDRRRRLLLLVEASAREQKLHKLIPVVNQWPCGDVKKEGERSTDQGSDEAALSGGSTDRESKRGDMQHNSQSEPHDVHATFQRALCAVADHESDEELMSEAGDVERRERGAAQRLGDGVAHHREDTSGESLHSTWRDGAVRECEPGSAGDADGRRRAGEAAALTLVCTGFFSSWSR